MSAEYSQRGVRGGTFGRGKVSHGRDLFKSDEARASEHPGPVYTPRNTPPSKAVHGGRSFGSAQKHTRDLWKAEEEHSREMPAMGLYNPKVATISSERRPVTAFGSTTARKAHGRDLWKAEEEHAKEIPGIGLYTPKITRKGPERPRSAVVFGSARMSHSRDLWKEQEQHGKEMPSAGQYYASDVMTIEARTGTKGSKGTVHPSASNGSLSRRSTPRQGDSFTTPRSVPSTAPRRVPATS